MKKLLNISLLLIILFFFTGCAALLEFLKEIPARISGKISAKASESTKVFSASIYLEKALEYEKNDELQMALFHMKIAAVLNPGDQEIAERTADLQSTIDHIANQHFEKGVAFYKKNRFKDARMQFLVSLRYNPDHKEALDYLKNRLAPKEYINYKVKKKDTLNSISKKFYKDPGKDFLIVYFNNLKADTESVPGTMLELPMLESEFTKPSIDIHKELKKAEICLQEERYGAVLGITGKILKYDHLNKKAADLKNAAYYQMGKWLSRHEQYPEAINLLNKADSEYGGVKEAIQEAINNELIKGKIFLKEKRYEEVLAVAGNILDYDKSNQAAKDLINTTYCRKVKGLIILKNYTEALKVLNNADPGYDCVEKSISNVNKAIKKQAEVHYLQGVKHFLNEELNDAINEWEMTLTLDPEHEKAKNNIQNTRSLLEKLEKVE